jgi:hypothetical protein
MGDSPIRYNLIVSTKSESPREKPRNYVELLKAIKRRAGYGVRGEPATTLLWFSGESRYETPARRFVSFGGV